MTAKRTAWLVVAAATVAVAVWSPTAVAAAEPTTAEQELAERYAPVMMLQQHPAECSHVGERFAPIPVDAVLGNPEVALRQTGPDDPVAVWGPTAQDLAGLGDGFHLDLPGLALEPACTYERDSRRFASGMPPTIYAHVVVQPDRPDRLVLQYWFYWYYNDWNDKHESDWEGIQLVFPASSAERALLVEPSEVGYSQHESGERADWDSDKLERDGSRPIVYSSAGSHASYFNSALYLERSTTQGMGCDDTGGPTLRVDPEVVLLPHSVDDADSAFAWLTFRGRWGERSEGPYNGPTGPAVKDRWERPIDRQESLRDSNTVVPTGDSSGAAVAAAFCEVVASGSDLFVTLALSPTRGALLAVGVLAIAVWAIRRTSWTAVDPVPVVARRRFGEALRGAFAVLAQQPVPVICIGLLAIPLHALGGVLAATIQAFPLVDDLMRLVDVDTRGAGGFGVSVTVAGLISLVTYMVAVAVAARMMSEIDAGRSPSVIDALGFVWTRRRQLGTAVLRAALIVVALMVTIVGIPFGLRQLVRYQFLPQAVILEGLGSHQALARSSELVRHRWWHTASVVALLNSGRAAVASVTGLLLLLVVQPPFWLLSVAVVVVDALLVPITAIVLTLVYGDAVATGRRHHAVFQPVGGPAIQKIDDD